jgi:hypothetical protein
LPISAVDTVSLAFQHTKEQLIRPFRLGQWIRLGLLGLATGELSSGGGCNFNVPGGMGGKRPSSSDQLLSRMPALPNLGHIPLAELVLIIAAAVLLVLLIGLAFIYLNSVCRFILFDSILKKQVVFEGSWTRWRPAGRRFFVWQILFQIVMMMVLVTVVGIPLGIAFAAGWFHDPKHHLLPLVFGGVLLVMVFLAIAFFALLVQVLAKDFVVPMMALEGLDWDDAWKRALAMFKAEKGGYAGYVGMKVVLAIAAGILLGIVTIIAMLVIIVPVVLIAVAVGIAGKMIWNPFTITLAVVAGLAAFAVILFVIAMISVPAVVFFPSYAIYFFAARYPALSARLYPPPPAPPSAPPLPPGPLGPEPAIS